MTDFSIILLVVLLFAVAFIYSNIGLGGGMLYVPLMLLLTQFPKNEIIGISLFLAFLTGLGSAYNHWKKKLVDFKIAVLLAAATIPGAVLGGTFGVKIGAKVVYTVFGFILILVCTKMLLELREPGQEREKSSPRIMVHRKRTVSRSRLAIGILAAVGTGLLSGIFGVGGGLILVAVMLYLLHMETRLTMGTSALVILPTALTGFGTYFYHSHFGGKFELNIPLTLVLGCFVLHGALLGSYWGLKALRTKQIKIIFVCVILLASVEVWYKVFSA